MVLNNLSTIAIVRASRKTRHLQNEQNNLQKNANVTAIKIQETTQTPPMEQM